MKSKKEFSKVLLIQESFLIWIVTLLGFALAFYCILMGAYGELGWVATLVGAPWTAYGASQAFYYKKSEKENIAGGIKYETVMAQIKTNDEDDMNKEPVEDAEG